MKNYIATTEGKKQAPRLPSTLEGEKRVTQTEFTNEEIECRAAFKHFLLLMIINGLWINFVRTELGMRTVGFLKCWRCGGVETSQNVSCWEKSVLAAKGGRMAQEEM